MINEPIIKRLTSRTCHLSKNYREEWREGGREEGVNRKGRVEAEKSREERGEREKEGKGRGRVEEGGKRREREGRERKRQSIREGEKQS